MNTESDDPQTPENTTDGPDLSGTSELNGGPDRGDGEELSESPQFSGGDVATQEIDSTICPRCQRPLPADSPGQLCPYCLLATDLADPGSAYETTKYSGVFVPPSPAELQPYFQSMDIISLIGHGGMGAVYRAHQRSLDRDVALKILPPEVAATEGFAQRFTREAHALARLGHPNIVAVYDHGTLGPYAYLVMELVEGVNLRDLMSGDRLPAEEAFRIVPQLCDALQFAHSRGVVHRDIKPENILIDETGRVIITDFGLAKMAESGEELGRTATRQVMGTVHYMAPEQIERPQEVDHRADLYSLGVVFYELLTGELPLGRFSPPSEKAGTSRGVDKVVLKSLEKEPQRRYASAEQVRSDLDRKQATSRARAAASAVDHRMRQAGQRVFAAAGDLSPRNRPVVSLVATLLFYLIGVVGLWVSFVGEAFEMLIVLTVILFLVSVWLKRFYQDNPVPPTFAGIEKPVTWVADVPVRLGRGIMNALRSLEGIRLPLMLAALISFALGVGLVVAAFMDDPDYLVGAVFAFVAGLFLTRFAIPRSVVVESIQQRCVTFAPVLPVLIPVGLLFVLWPGIAWMAFASDDTPPDWFINTTGIDLSLLVAAQKSNVRLVLAHVFGGLTIQMLWCAFLATINALFPAITRWLARPILDGWAGRWRWWIAIFCYSILAITALAFTIVSTT